MSDRNEARSGGAGWHPGVAADDPIQRDWSGPEGRAAGGIRSSHEEMLRNPDGRHAQPDAHEASEPEERRMEAAVSVDEEEIGFLTEGSKRRLHGWELTVGQVRRDVGEVNVHLARGDVDGLERPCVESDGDRERSVPYVCHIDAPEGGWVRDRVHFDDSLRQSLLLRPQAVEEMIPG